MNKIRNISEFQSNFSFLSMADEYSIFLSRFLKSDLGKIYSAIPWNAIVLTLGLKENRKGPLCQFSPRGKIALMFLKNYSGVSDKKLIEQLNGNIEYQFFCNIHLGSERIENYKIVSKIRTELSKSLNIENLQQCLYNHWKNHITDSSCMTMDATCYESNIRYPTDVKLLWESIEWSYAELKKHNKRYQLKHFRTKYTKWLKRYVNFSKMRRKTKKKRIPLTRALLKLLKKLNDRLQEIEIKYRYVGTKRYHKRRATIIKAYKQQYVLFHENKYPKNRIVSIDKEYIRPIVRGKEKKPVEFGAKVHKYQLDGISFIEHIDFEAYNEGVRYKETIFKVQRMTRRKLKVVGADGIYATNKNRVFSTKNGIVTDFKRKGKAGRNENQRNQISKLITKERASRLEGSFGKDKEYYHLKRIKARTKENEILWIFFGIHVSNALEIGRRIYQNQKIAA